MTTVRAVIALGSNLGSRIETLTDAVAELDRADGVRVIAVSTFHETVAMRLEGPDEDAPRYVNAVAIVETTLDPFALHAVMRGIESHHGRERHERWGDRTLDLDLIDFDGRVIVTEDLTVPHPRAHERLFVLDPWIEIDPQARIPGVGPVANARKVLS